jgi:hypothetical protein
MRVRYPLFICVILVFSGFDVIKFDNPSAADEKNKQFHAKFLFSDSGEVAYFECEDFASEALNKYTIAEISQEFRHILNCTKKPTFNRHDADVIDTIYTFSNPHNQIQIYRAKQNDFIFTFNVSSPIFDLTGNIRPGITKNAFSRKFHIAKPANNAVQIASANGNIQFMFYFENNRLKRINTYWYLD